MKTTTANSTRIYGQSFVKQALYIVAGSSFLALMSQVSIPLFFTPVPMTLQMLALFLLGAFQGSKIAAFSVIAYLVEGACGLPVFAGGTSNPLWFLGLRAGYLVGFVAAAYLVGKIVEMSSKVTLFRLLFAMTAAQAAVYLLGFCCLSFFVGFSQAFVLGVIPFLAVDALKIVSAALIAYGTLTILKEKLFCDDSI